MAQGEESESEVKVMCPHCRIEFEFSLKLTCKRCGYHWVRRSGRLPEVCPNPKCKSPYWNREKRVKKGREAKK